jgi:hypothetical protein
VQQQQRSVWGCCSSHCRLTVPSHSNGWYLSHRLSALTGSGTHQHSWTYSSRLFGKRAVLTCICCLLYLQAIDLKECDVYSYKSDGETDPFGKIGLMHCSRLRACFLTTQQGSSWS